MAFGIVTPASPVTSGGVNDPSMTIWADCPGSLYWDRGGGFFVTREFDADVTLPALPNAADGSPTYAFDTTTGPSGSPSNTILKASTAATINDGLSIWTRPLGGLVPNSGAAFWAEASISLASITNVNGFFFGLIENAGLAKDVFAVASATKASNTIQDYSMAGFFVPGSQLTNIDAMYRINTSTGSPVAYTVSSNKFVLSPILGSSALTSQGVTQTALVATATAGATFTKLGLRFDGLQYLYWYLNGYQFAKTLVQGNLDTTKQYGVILSITSGTASTAAVVDVDFFRGAAGEAEL